LKQFLNKLGYGVKESELFDSNTKKSLIKLQKTLKLSTKTGVLDGVTRAAIDCANAKYPTVNSGAKNNSTTPRSFSGKYIFTRDLDIGYEGQDVLELQKKLNALGFIISTSGMGSLGNETTYFGEKTRLALIKFQISK